MNAVDVAIIGGGQAALACAYFLKRVGYGDWTGAASATLVGVTRTARSTVDEIKLALG